MNVEFIAEFTEVIMPKRARNWFDCISELTDWRVKHSYPRQLAGSIIARSSMVLEAKQLLAILETTSTPPREMQSARRRLQTFARSNPGAVMYAVRQIGREQPRR